MDLRSQADDLTSIGLPGYFGIRVDVAIADKTLLGLAMRGLPLVIPDTPKQGSSGTSPASDPDRAYAICIWVDGDASPPNGDGQPNWPTSTVKSDAAISGAIVGSIEGLPIDGI